MTLRDSLDPDDRRQSECYGTDRGESHHAARVTGRKIARWPGDVPAHAVRAVPSVV